MSLTELLNVDTFKKTMKGLFDFDFLETSSKYRASDIYDLENSSEMAYANLINAESELGRTLFGPIPEGHQREFFEHKKNVWVWHDGWFDEVGKPHGTTIRYEVKPEGVFKKVAGQPYARIEGEELDNFRKAARMYLKLIKTNLYH